MQNTAIGQLTDIADEAITASPSLHDVLATATARISRFCHTVKSAAPQVDRTDIETAFDLLIDAMMRIEAAHIPPSGPVADAIHAALGHLDTIDPTRFGTMLFSLADFDGYSSIDHCRANFNTLPDHEKISLIMDLADEEEDFSAEWVRYCQNASRKQ